MLAELAEAFRDMEHSLMPAQQEIQRLLHRRRQFMADAAQAMRLPQPTINGLLVRLATAAIPVHAMRNAIE